MIGGSVDELTAIDVDHLAGNEVRRDRRQECHDLAARLSQGPTLALGLTKELLNDELSMDLWAAIETEARAQAFLMKTHDFREAYDAFVQKRPARFEGR